MNTAPAPFANPALSILLVDDDAGHRTMLKTLLHDWGYSVSEADDGEKAVALCKERPFDLVLMDVRMPKKSGLEALLEMKAYNPALPVLIMTAFSNVEAAVSAIKTGAYDYLTKPLDFEKLKISLRNVFAHAGLLKENENLHLSLNASLHTSPATASIIGQSPSMRAVLDLVHTIAPSETTVLISGESGTGKELIAKALHRGSLRARGPYVAVNCAAITESLLESELFGHEKGAFTGADKRHEGHFARANGGTLFLDEIGEMPLAMQVKLLRAIQEREVLPVGGEKPVAVGVRIVAATNRDLPEEVAAGRFREDLYYRLNVVSLALPPLRERVEDIPLLCQHFLAHFAERNNKSVKGFTPGAMDFLIRYPWPGNVRELENTMERAVVLLLGEYISERELPARVLTPAGPGGAQGASAATGGQGAVSSALATVSLAGTLEDLERAAILSTLEKVGGNRSEAAKVLGITRKTLYSKLLKYNLE